LNPQPANVFQIRTGVRKLWIGVRVQTRTMAPPNSTRTYATSVTSDKREQTDNRARPRLVRGQRCERNIRHGVLLWNTLSAAFITNVATPALCPITPSVLSHTAAVLQQILRAFAFKPTHPLNHHHSSHPLCQHAHTSLALSL
jgi:hypothetical protein